MGEGKKERGEDGKVEICIFLCVGKKRDNLWEEIRKIENKGKFKIKKEERKEGFLY